MTSQIMFYFDSNRCIDCKTCETSCNDYYDLFGVHRRKVLSYYNEDLMISHLSLSCNHCDNPICITVCPENNYKKRVDGIVVQSVSNCRGCERCISACPFQAPKLNPKTKRADKCNLCVDRIDQGVKPVCVENCITSALSLIEVDSNEKKKNTFNNNDIPIMSYTNPSIILVSKKKGNIFMRKE